MAENGIGASVRRKEDNRFLTGKGNYTDDINVVGQTYAYFVRSPYAHAILNSIDTSAASASDGVVAVLTGDDLAEDGIAPLICGVNVTSEVLLFAQRHGDDAVVTSSVVDPRLQRIAAAIDRELPLWMLDPDPFVDLPKPPRLGRFSRYWREAEAVVWKGF